MSNDIMNAQSPIATQSIDAYATPEILLATSQLSKEHKSELLKQWAIDLEAKLRASDENMTMSVPERDGEMLRRVKVAQQTLDAL